MKKIGKLEKHTSYWQFVLNIAMLLVLLGLFISLFSSIMEAVRFMFYMLLLFVGGLGLLLLFRKPVENSIVYFIISFFVGIITNYMLFIGFRFFKLNVSYTPYLLAVLGVVLVMVNVGKLKEIIKKTNIYFDPKFFLLIILIIFSIFLFSDKLTYTEEGIYVHDARHPTTELSFSQSLKTMFPVDYLSYEGKEFNYHFGYGILSYQLIHDFKIEHLNLAYIVFPAFIVIILFLLIYEYSKMFVKRKGSLLFCWAVLFSTLFVPLKTILIGVNTFLGLNLGLPDNPLFIFSQFIKMGSFSLAIVMAILLLIIVQNKKEKEDRNYFLEMVLLTGLAISKITFFIVFAGAYFMISFLNLIWTGKIKKFVFRIMMLVPGGLYLLYFVTGAHPHNVWVFFINTFNTKSLSLSYNLLIPNAIVGLLLAIIVSGGIGLFYIIPEIKKVLQRKELIARIKNSDKNLLFLFIIIISYGFGTFIFEVTENNHEQFLIPGYILLTFLTYKLIFTSKIIKKKIVATIIISLIIFNSLFLGVFFFSPTNKLPYNYENSDNNILADIKIKMVKNIFNKPLASSVDCLYSPELIEALKVLSNQPEGIFLMNQFYQSCENYNVSSWDEIMISKNAGFIKTGISGKQTIAEGYNFKGVLMEKNYCERTYENILFYHFVIGKEKDIGKLLPLFNQKVIPKYNQFSYYSFFNKFSKNNLYTENVKFLDCIKKKIKNKTLSEEFSNSKETFIKEYLIKNKIKYILFERGETPTEKYKKILGLSELYHSEKVKLFAVNIESDYPPKTMW